jgi:hypothetical protein
MQAGFGGWAGSRVQDSPSGGQVDAEVELQLRRLSKRDATTKLKALAALREHVLGATPEAVAAFCPLWLHALQRLVSDGNRSVRGAAATLCGHVVSSGGRSVAAHVRALLSLWWPLQFDTERDTAAAASAALDVAFPGARRLEATAFAADALCTAASASLRLRTPSELPDPPVSPEEGAERLARVHAAALRTLAELPVVLAAPEASDKVREQAAAAAAKVAELLSTEHAWLKTQCKAPTAEVRGAAFAVLASLHRTVPAACADHLAAIVSAAINAALTEKSQTALPEALEAALACLQAGGDAAWSIAQPAPEQRLHALFAAAFHGSSQCARFALPLLSLLPARLVGAAPEPGPAAALLEALWEGRSCVQAADTGARLALDAAYGECAGFAVLRCRQAALRAGAGAEDADAAQTALLQGSFVTRLLATLLQDAQLSASDVKSLAAQFGDAAVMLTGKASLCAAAKQGLWASTTLLVAQTARCTAPGAPPAMPRIEALLTRLHSKASGDWIVPTFVRPLVAELLPEGDTSAAPASLMSTVACCVRLFGASACVRDGGDASSTGQQLEALLRGCLHADAALAERAELVAALVGAEHALWSTVLDSAPGSGLLAHVLAHLTAQSKHKPASWLLTFRHPALDSAVLGALTSLGEAAGGVELGRVALTSASLLSPDCAAAVMLALAERITSRDAGAKPALALAVLALQHCPEAGADAHASLAAAVFQQHLAARLAHAADEADDSGDDEDELAAGDDPLGRAALAAWKSVSDYCLRGMPAPTRAALAIKLAQAVRDAACTSPAWRGGRECAAAVSSFTATVTALCSDEPQALDAALDAICAPCGDCWPTHVAPPSSASGHMPADGHARMVHLLLALCHQPELDPATVLGGHRVWLAAELLCCPGAAGDILPVVVSHASLRDAALSALAAAVDEAAADRVEARTAGFEALLRAVAQGPDAAGPAVALFRQLVQPRAQAQRLSSSQLRLVMTALPHIMRVVLAFGDAGARQDCQEFTLAACRNAGECLRARGGSGVAAANAALLLVAACFPDSRPAQEAELAALCSVWEAIAAADAAAAAGLAAARRFGGGAEEGASLSEADVGTARVGEAVVLCAWKQMQQPHWSFLLARLHRWLDSPAPLLCSHSAEEAVQACTSPALELPGLACAALLRIQRLPLEVAEPSAGFTGDVVPYAADGPPARAAARVLCQVSWPTERSALFASALAAMFSAGAMRLSHGSVAVGRAVGALSPQAASFWRRCCEVCLCAPSGAVLAAAVAFDARPGSSGALASLYALLLLRGEVQDAPLVASMGCSAFALLASPALRYAAVFGLDAAVADVDKVLQLVDERAQNAKDAAAESEDDGAAQLGGAAASLMAAETAALRQPLAAVLAGGRGSAHLLGWALLLGALLDGSRAEQLRGFVTATDALSGLLDMLLADLPLPTPKALRQSSALPAQVAQAWRCASAPQQWLRTAAQLPPSDLAGALFGAALHALPAQCRTWFATLRDSSTCGALEGAVAHFVSPALISSELRAAVAAPAVPGLTVTVSDRDITAAYSIDDALLQVAVRFGPAHPLRAPDVDCARRVGVSEARLRKWLLAMNAALRTGGGVAAALALWGAGCAREFEGVEPCPICYMTVHASSHALPRLACRQCRNRFHGACLYNWFETRCVSTRFCHRSPLSPSP